MRKVTLRPDKYYSVHELSEVLGLAPYDLFNLINKSRIIYDLVDDKAVYKGAVISNIDRINTMYNSGYIPFYRDELEDWLIQDPQRFMWWIWIRLHLTFEKGPG